MARQRPARSAKIAPTIKSTRKKPLPAIEAALASAPFPRDAEAAGRLAAIVESSDDAIIGETLTGIITHWSRGAETLFGYHAAEILGKPITTLIPRERLMEEKVILGRLRRGERIRHYETARRSKDGRMIDVSLSISPVTDPSGRLVGAVKIVRDISVAKRVEQTLRDSATRMQAIVTTAADAIITIDRRGIMESANPAAEQLFKYSAQELIGQNVRILMPEPFRGEHDGYIQRYLRTGRAKIIGIGREVVGLRKDGSTFPMRLAVSEMRLGNQRMFTGIVHDLTARRRLEQEIIETSGNEQRRIGQDLHDGLCQMLTGVSFGVENLARQLEKSSPPDAATARRLGELVREAITQARHLARGLNPVNLDRLGLAASLKDLAEKVSETFRITCRFDAAGEIPDVGGNIATHLYRIAQEAVNNANRHGKASRIDIRVACARGQLALTVIDNGKGVPASTAVQPVPVMGDGAGARPAQFATGMGLHSMNYRARLMGGVFSIRPAPRGGGTIVNCTIPLQSSP